MGPDYYSCILMSDFCIPGGIMSTFLLGVHDPATDKFLTVTKCTGLDDQTMNQVNRDLDVNKISKDASKVPSWLSVSRTLVPDFVVKDPKVKLGNPAFTNSNE